MSHHIVEVRDLFFAYPDGTEALKGVSFRVEHGGAVALVGANGAGREAARDRKIVKIVYNITGPPGTGR